MVRYVSDIARYTEIHITYNILYPWNCRIWQPIGPGGAKIQLLLFWLTDNASQAMCRCEYDQPFSQIHMPNSNSSLVTVIKPKAKKNVYMGIMLSFYILPKYFFNKCSTFFQVLLPYKFQYKVSNPSIMPAS
jgi:hypothetical protein